MNLELSKITEYNSKQNKTKQIPVCLFEYVQDILDRNGLEWLGIPVNTFLTSIIESIPKTIEGKRKKKDEEKIQNNFNEYMTDSLGCFFNCLCTLTSVCNTQTNISVLLPNKPDDEINSVMELYTKYSNMISENISDGFKNDQDKKHKDSFFAVPDFKFDINVEPITNYRCTQGDHNLSIIHIHPSKFKDYTATLRTIAHEVGHHVGQTDELRKLRSGLYIRCLIYYILSGCCVINEDTEDDELKNSLKELVGIISDHIISWCDKNQKKFENSTVTKTLYEGSDIIYGDTKYYYYTATTFEAVNDFWNFIHKSIENTHNGKNDESNAITKKIPKKHELDELCNEIYEKHSNPESILKLFPSRLSSNTETYYPAYEILKETNTPDNSALRKDYVINCIGTTVFRALDGYLYGNAEDINSLIKNLKSIEEQIYILFRECYADLFMFLITSYKKDGNTKSQIWADIYFDRMMEQSNNITIDDSNAFHSNRIRLCTIYKYLIKHNENDQKLNMPKKFKNIESYCGKLNLFECFHIDCVLEYLENAEGILSDQINNNEYFSKLRAIFNNLDNSDNSGNSASLDKVLFDLYKLHNVNISKKEQ